MSRRALLAPEQAILGILCNRSWPTTESALLNDRAWSYITNPNPADYDFPDCCPSMVSVRIALSALIDNGMVEQTPGNPVAYMATDAGYHWGQGFHDTIRQAFLATR